MAAAQSSPAPFVPAWKRLGLKLKSDPASAPAPNASASGPQEAEPKAAAKLSSKKRKASSDLSSTSTPSKVTDQRDDKSAKRRKSVSFADGSKETDGDENTKLLEDFAAQQNGGDGEFTKAEISTFTSSKPAEVKDKPKKKERKPRTEETESQEETAYVRYLKEYHTARETWKFNKNHQNKLLANLFNTYRVPFEVDEALESYLITLQGEGVRKRVQEQAQTIITETADLDEKMDGNDQFAAAKDKSLRAHLKQTKGILRNQEAVKAAFSEEHREKLRKRKRAELVLKSLGASASNPVEIDDEANARAKVTEPGAKRARRRKSRVPKSKRTGIPDDDDTDETSSVSSVPSSTVSSSSESEEDEDAGGISSDSSDSDSDSDSDDEDGASTAPTKTSHGSLSASASAEASSSSEDSDESD